MGESGTVASGRTLASSKSSPRLTLPRLTVIQEGAGPCCQRCPQFFKKLENKTLCGMFLAPKSYMDLCLKGLVDQSLVLSVMEEASIFY